MANGMSRVLVPAGWARRVAGGEGENQRWRACRCWNACDPRQHAKSFRATAGRGNRRWQRFRRGIVTCRASEPTRRHCALSADVRATVTSQGRDELAEGCAQMPQGRARNAGPRSLTFQKRDRVLSAPAGIAAARRLRRHRTWTHSRRQPAKPTVGRRSKGPSLYAAPRRPEPINDV